MRRDRQPELDGSKTPLKVIHYEVASTTYIIAVQEPIVIIF